MTPAMILALVQGAITLAPELMALYQKAVAGLTVTEADVEALLGQYGTNRAALEAAIVAKS